MSSKNISIRDKVYEELRSEKKPGESFADVIERLLKSGKPPLSKFSGTISKETADLMENGLEELSELEKRELADPSEV